MSQQLDRAELVRLLDGLAAEKDEDVLSAARAVQEMVSAAELSWDQLLAATDRGGDAEPEQGGGDAEPESAAPMLTGAVPNEQDAANLIERMLAKSDISDSLREELQGYRDDIAEGEFDEGDRKYLQALYERLNAR